MPTWFSHGGRRGAAVTRIALALSMLVVVRALDGAPLGAASSYRPLARWLVLDLVPLAQPVLDGVRIAAWVALVAMLVGLFSRASAALALGCAAVLAVVQASATGATVGHDSLPFLALLGFLGARGGDTYALDAVIRQLRGRPPIAIDGGYRWSIRLVELAVALAAASPVIAAVRRGDAPGLDPLALAGLGPLLALLVPWRWPWPRALLGAGGLAFALVGPGVATGAWNLAWLPLAAVFVDWDRLIDWSADRVVRDRAPSPPLVPYRHAVAAAFVVAFVALELALVLTS